MNTFANNIEVLYESVKTYVQTSLELSQLKVIGKVVDLLSSFVTKILSFVSIIFFSLFVNIALSLYLGEIFGKNYLGFLAVSGIYLIIYFLIIIFRPLIKAPISNLLLVKLLKK